MEPGARDAMRVRLLASAGAEVEVGASWYDNQCMGVCRVAVLVSGVLVGCARVPDPPAAAPDHTMGAASATAVQPTTAEPPPSAAPSSTANKEPPFEMSPDVEPIEEDEDEEEETDEELAGPPSNTASSGGPIDPSIFVSPHGLDVPCKSNYDCWLDDEGNIIPTPPDKRGRLLHPCGDGSRIPMCVDGVCEIRHFGC
jgi:hypothetical protein